MSVEMDRNDPFLEIRERLSRARRAWRAAEFAGGLLRGLALLLTVFLIAFVADNLLALPGWLRLACSAAFLGGTAYLLIVQPARNLLRPLSDEMVAVHLESSAAGLDNRLINSVLLQREQFDNALTRRMASSQLDETLHAVRNGALRAPAARALLMRRAVKVGALALAVGVYALIFRSHFANAFERYSAPTRFIAPITQTRLEVSPGNAELLQGDPLLIEARVEGALPEKAFIDIDEPGSDSSRQTMPFEGSTFTWKFTSVQKDFRYRVTAGDAVSDTFSVIVRTRPSLKDIRLTTAYPAYMKLPEKSESSPVGNVSAPIGSSVRIAATVDRPVSAAWLDLRLLAIGDQAQSESREIAMTLKESVTADAVLTVERSGQYAIRVKDAAGIPNQPIIAQIVALPDDAPALRVIEPSQDMAVDTDAKVTLLAEAKDDFGVQSVALFVQSKAGAEWEKRREWTYAPGTRAVREGAVLDMAMIKAAVGDVVSFYFKGEDGNPQRDETSGKTRIFQITVIDKTTALVKEKAQLEAFKSRLQRLVTMQKANLDATRQVCAWLARGSDTEGGHSAKAAPLVKAEEAIYSDARDAVRTFAGTETGSCVEALASIAAKDITAAVAKLAAFRDATEAATLAAVSAAAQSAEEEALAALEKLLNDPNAFAIERLNKDASQEKLKDQPDDLSGAKAKVEKIRDALKEFIRDQEDALKQTKQLGEKAVDDFTQEDNEKLQQVIDTEMKWAKFFQEAATDLSKLPPQDFSLPDMAKELLEVFHDVKKAADAAEKKAMEIAVPLEQSGLELAKEIETNIEKWLPETPDREAWKMEDPTQEFDVPLQQLPDELQDMIGDLMEEEKDLMEEAADATSAWLDSMDKAVGWDAADGPIADMSAKGVTGNRLPDEQEIGGRSGEGRTGKSSGQFVEETATGKGGRQTPTRLTQDPYEAGVVKDTSAEPATGSTGGGKASGFGQEGFRGQVPPKVQEELKRMANQQQQLIDKAERIDVGLKKYNYPRGELPKTIELMKQVQGDMAQGNPMATAGTRSRVVLSNLDEVKNIVARQKEVNRDSAALLPKELRDEVAASLREDVPAQYKDMVESYFKALSESGSVHK